MIRFIDLTGQIEKEDKRPVAAFLNTANDRFIEGDDNSHLFHGVEDVEHIFNRDYRERCLHLLPDRFFKES